MASEDLEMADLRRQVEALQKTITEISGDRAPTFVNTVPAPETFSFQKQEWKAWIKHFDRFRMAAKLDKATEKSQINILLLHNQR